MSADNENVSKVDVEPLDGWQPNGPYGFQQLDDSPWGRLVRIEVVLHWLSEKLPRDSVIYALGNALVRNGGDAVGWLWVLNARSFPIPLMQAGVLSHDSSWFWQSLCEHVSIGSTEEDVARAIADEWDYAWPGLADPATDEEWAMARVIAENRRLASLNVVQPSRREIQRRDTSLDSEDRRYSLSRLCKLAIPVPKAYELWGWGRVVESVRQVDALSGSQPKATLEAQDVTDWLSLVQYRLQFVSMDAQKRPEWRSEHVAVLAGRVQESYQAGQGRGALNRLAKDLRATRQALAQLLEKHQYSPSTGQKDAGWIEKLSGFGDRKKA